MGTTSSHSHEKGASHTESSEQQSALVVEQPHKLEGLLETINLLNTISERASEDRSGDMGGGGGTATTQGDQKSGTSARDDAIANLPTEHVLRVQLKQHIEKEVKVLQKEVRRAARRATKPGSAYQLNKLYARIRRLNALLTTIMETSYDVAKRLFIRIFIDKQPVL